MQHTMRHHGVVKSVRESYEDPDLADVEIEEPPTAKQRAEHKKMQDKGPPMVHGPGGRRHTHTMPKDTASHFALGDAVEMEHTLRHYGRRRKSQADGGERKGEEEQEK
jgi:hypothetical protein